MYRKLMKRFHVYLVVIVQSVAAQRHGLLVSCPAMQLSLKQLRRTVRKVLFMSCYTKYLSSTELEKEPKCILKIK